MELFPWSTKVKLQDCEKKKNKSKHRNKTSMSGSASALAINSVSSVTFRELKPGTASLFLYKAQKNNSSGIFYVQMQLVRVNSVKTKVSVGFVLLVHFLNSTHLA